MEDNKEEINQTNSKKEQKKQKKEAKRQKIEKLPIDERNKKNRKRRFILVSIFTLLVILITSIGIRANYLEFSEMGENYKSSLTRSNIYTFSSLIINFIFLYVLFYFTHRKTKKILKIFFDDEKKEMPNLPQKSTSFVIAIVGSILATVFILNSALLATSNSWFGIKDPVFKVDISYFVFIKPFVRNLIIYLMIAIVASIVYAIAYSLIVLNKSFDGISRETFQKCNIVKIVGTKVRFFAVLLGLFLIITMATNIGNEKFMNIELSDGNIYSLYGASKADATVKLVGYFVLGVLATFSILKAYTAIKKEMIRRAVGYIMVVPVYLIILALVLAIYSGITSSSYIDQNENYIKSNIEMTKSSYSLNSNYKNIDYSGTITTEEIHKNENIINNMPIVSKDKVIQDAKLTQTIKGYYTFRDAQVGMYNINNKPTICYITPREISNKDTTYSNKTYQYTHGFGLIANPAGSTDKDGNLISYSNEFGDLSNAEIPITQPRIYYGMETNSAAVINSTKSEFDYVNEGTSENVEYSYEGDVGLKLNFLDRLILGIKEGDIKLATSLSLKEESRILTNRNIIKRAKAVMPYLSYDNNPYLVVSDDGKLYWVIDAYTTSNEVPFSQKYEGPNYKQINYIKNSCKVIINAYDGSMKFYITDRTDPIIMAYNNIYPNLFATKDDTIPEDIAKHLVYSEYLFNIQSNFAAVYHDATPDVLYRGKDIWEVCDTTYTNNSENHISPYYTMVKDNDGNDTLGIVIPYSTYDKQNIIGYMVGYMNGQEMVRNIYAFNSSTSVPGLLQLETQINQDETIAEEIAALNVSGTRISRKMYAVPVDNTILYVETVYQDLINERDQKPTLKKVIIASGNKLAIGDTAKEAINNLTSKALNLDIVDTNDKDSLINQIIKSNKNLKNSSKNNDWKLYGEDMAELTGLIDQLESTVEKETQNKIAENAILSNQVSNETSNETN